MLFVFFLIILFSWCEPRNYAVQDHVPQVPQQEDEDLEEGRGPGGGDGNAQGRVQARVAAGASRHG